MKDFQAPPQTAADALDKRSVRFQVAHGPRSRMRVGLLAVGCDFRWRFGPFMAGCSASIPTDRRVRRVHLCNRVTGHRCLPTFPFVESIREINLYLVLSLSLFPGLHQWSRSCAPDRDIRAERRKRLGPFLDPNRVPDTVSTAHNATGEAVCPFVACPCRLVGVGGRGRG